MEKPPKVEQGEMPSAWGNPDLYCLTRQELVTEINQESQNLDAETYLDINRELNKQKLNLDDPNTYRRLKESYALKERDGSINGVPVHFAGVYHTPETLVFERARLEELISNAGTVVIEGAPEISKVTTTSFINDLVGELKAKGMKTENARTWAEESTRENPFNIFFHEMEQLAKKYDKPIVTADPDSGADKLRELTHEWAQGSEGKLRDAAIDMQTAIASGWSAMLLGGLGTLALADIERDRERSAQLLEYALRGKKEGEREEDALKMPPLSRRKVLTGLGTLGVAGVLTPTVGVDRLTIDKEGIPKDDSPERALASYDVLDYRNTAVARAIDRMTKQGALKGPILFVYGAAHTDNILNYLKHPTFRDAKYALYAPLHAVKSPEFVEYKYEPDAKAEGGYSWKQLAREDL